MSTHAKNSQTQSGVADPRRGVRSHQDIVMEYVVMAVTIACVLAGVGQLVSAWQPMAFSEPAQAFEQQSLARCERPALGILQR